MSRPANARYARIDLDAILDAALSLAAAEGAARVTLDAVATRAGVSKGGLLYRFPSKEALLIGMIDRLNAVFDEAVVEAKAHGAPSLLAAYVEAALTDDDDHDAALASLLAVAAERPHLIERFRAPQKARLDAILAEGAALEDAAFVILAADGLWLSGLIGFSPFDAGQIAAIKTKLRALARR
jgi:AcrR family transcriptional regulator